MRDKRPVDELSIEELEKILAIRRREARIARLQRYESAGRRVNASEASDEVVEPDQSEATGPDQAERPPEPVNEDPKVYFEGEPQFEDELDARHRPRKAAPNSLRKMLWNRALLVVEIIAALGLVFLFVSMYQALQDMSRFTASIQAQAQATANAQFVPPTPTPLITFADVVLPTGHTFNGETAYFNLDEVPAQYREQVKAQLSQPAVQPTQSPESPIRIKIDSIGVDASVVSGDDWEALKLGAGHKIGSANPGQRGNMVISAHNDVFGELFRKLDQMRPGDKVIVSSPSRDFVYVVQPQQKDGQTIGYQIVSPTDVWVLQSRGDTKQLTLISCYPYRQDNKRIVVFAYLQ